MVLEAPGTVGDEFDITDLGGLRHPRPMGC